MNKQELVTQVAGQAGISKPQATAAVNAVFEAIQDALKSGDAVTLIGFGTFDVRERAERSARNPRSGEPITIPASRVPHFKAGKALRGAVAG